MSLWTLNSEALRRRENRITHLCREQRVMDNLWRQKPAVLLAWKINAYRVRREHRAHRAENPARNIARIYWGGASELVPGLAFGCANSRVRRRRARPQNGQAIS